MKKSGGLRGHVARRQASPLCMPGQLVAAE